MTVLEVIQRAADYLGRKGVEAPRLQAELLLAHVLACPRLRLYLDFERVLSDQEVQTTRELVRRRSAFEPLQYLVGSTSFCGFELKLSPAVLIPRPETEILAERAWTWLGEMSAASPRVLDFGTGSGCLAIALAVRCPRAMITAVDASAAALALAAENAVRHDVAGRIQFRHTDDLAGFEGERFDLIVANPPYIPTGQLAELQPEVRDHEPRLALDGGTDGLTVIRMLAARASACLHPTGRLMMEFGDGQADAVRTLFEAHAWRLEGLIDDLAGRPRHLVAAPSGAFP